MKTDIVHNNISSLSSGIIVNGGGSTIRNNNRLENNRYFGLEVSGTTAFNVTGNNTFKNNSGGGLHLSAGIYLGANTSVTIGEDNEISYNDDYGIWINGGNATIRDRNKIHHNDYGIYVDTTYAPWIRDNNTIHNNTQAGVYLSSSVGTFNRQIWWNDIKDNGIGIEAEDPGPGNYFHAECNWWDDATGPFDNSTGEPDYNPLGQGQEVSDYFHYRTDGQGGQYWYLDFPAAQATSCS